MPHESGATVKLLVKMRSEFNLIWRGDTWKRVSKVKVAG